MDAVELVLLASGGRHLAVPLDRVVEVLPMAAPHPLPHAPPYLAGILDLHGRLVPLVELAVLLGGEPSEHHPQQHILLVDLRGLEVGLIVERMVDVLPAARVSPEQPRWLNPTRGVAALAGTSYGPVPVLSLEVLLAPDRWLELHGREPSPEGWAHA